MENETQSGELVSETTLGLDSLDERELTDTELDAAWGGIGIDAAGLVIEIPVL